MFLHASPCQAKWSYRRYHSRQNDLTGVTIPGRMISQAYSRHNDFPGVTIPIRMILWDFCVSNCWVIVDLWYFSSEEWFISENVLVTVVQRLVSGRGFLCVLLWYSGWSMRFLLGCCKVGRFLLLWHGRIYVCTTVA